MRGTAYERLELKMKRGGCVVMDGGLATELERNGLDGYRAGNRTLWGTWALRHAPDAVSAVHNSYLEAGCEVVSTATWGVLQMPEWEEDVGSALGEPVHWMDVARHGLRLTRRMVEKAGRSGEAVVAFCVSGDIDDTAALERFQLLGRVFERERPDLILVDTITLFREGLTVPLVASMAKTGIPVWLSFRRCRRGVCGIYGQHWGGPEGDLFGRMAHRFEGMGVEAILIGGIPIGHISGMMAWLRDFTDLPLGVSPILGHYLDPGWKFDESIGPERYANEAMAWQAEGARLIGGNAGVTTEHIRAYTRRPPFFLSAATGHAQEARRGLERRAERSRPAGDLIPHGLAGSPRCSVALYGPSGRRDSRQQF